MDIIHSFIISTALDVTEGIFAVLYVSIMGLTRFYKTTVFLHLYTVKPRPPGAMRLRTHGHDFELPIIKYEFNSRNFIVRSLFNYA